MFDIEQHVEDYTRRIGTPAVQLATADSEHYMNLSREELRRLSPEELDEIAYMLGRLAYHLSKKRGVELAIARAAGSAAKVEAVKYFGKYDAYGFEWKYNAALADEQNHELRALDEQRMYAQARVDALQELAGRVADIAATIKDLKYIKIKQRSGS